MTNDNDVPETHPAPLPQPAGPRVLVAEDDAINRTVAQRLLERLGATVELAPNGQRAVEMATQRDYDLVFMDVQMPVMDGLAATRALREAGLVKLPVVAMTASTGAEQKLECAAAGMNDLVPKPIDAQYLADVLSRWTAQPSQRLPATPTWDLSGLPTDVPQLDVGGALARMLGRKTLYLEILLRYVQTQRDVPERLRAALAQGDSAAAFVLAHTAKGLAATVGATEAQARAQTLEQLLRPPVAQRAAIEQALAALEHSLEALFVALTPRMAATPDPPPSSAQLPASPE